MKYPYYTPNLRFIDAFKSFFISKKKAEKRIKNYFVSLTGKQYIFITNSCRSALYLAYKAAGIDRKEIITSPLTCKVAIDPIEESGNKPVFADINTDDLNINANDVEHRITKQTSAIQAIHIGGVSCKMDVINDIAEKHNLWVIEDCAQSMGAEYDGHYTGSFGDIACFSLIKNAYGIGGGILATDSKKVYDKAIEGSKNIRSTFSKLLVYRIIRSIFETYRKYYIGNLFYKILIKAKGKRKSYNSVKNQLKKISNLELKISAIQIKKLNHLHHKRKSIGKKYYHRLVNEKILSNNNFNPDNSSFTKFFIFNPAIDTKKVIKNLLNQEIEVMHLEHKAGSPYQEMFVKESAVLRSLPNYKKIHDSIISLPIVESYREEELNEIIENIKNEIHK